MIRMKEKTKQGNGASCFLPSQTSSMSISSPAAVDLEPHYGDDAVFWRARLPQAMREDVDVWISLLLPT
jgi:hypothetical protein